MSDVPKKVSCVQFSLLSPEEIERVSVVEITKSETIENGRPVPNGLFDMRMGVTERDEQCLTCNQDGKLCNGHYGHLNLAQPVFNITFMKNIKQILDVICFKCSRLLVDTNKYNIKSFKGKNKLKMVRQYTSSLKKKCLYCGLEQPKIKKQLKGDVKFTCEIKNEKTGEREDYDITAEDVLIMFEKMTDDDVSLIGLNPKYSRPEWLILTKLLIAPPAVRPAMKRDDNQRAEDDLTVSYATIIKENRKLREKIDKDPLNINIKNLVDDLTVAIGLMLDSGIRNSLKNQKLITGSSKKVVKSIKDRLITKGGRIRGNLQGKRVNDSGRTVIGGDPKLRVDEIGIPLKIVMNLTYPEVVTKYNKEKLYNLLTNGPYKYPGVKSYIDSTNKNYERRLDYISNANIIDDIVLKEGDIVRRHLMDGDIVLFNRQPSLHKLSMMAHRVRVMHVGNTFRMNVSATSPYNADFDGDEMNIFLPRSVQAVAELENIALIARQIVSPQTSTPAIGIVQDALVGTSKFTHSSVELNAYDISSLLMWNYSFDGTVPPPLGKGTATWTGKQIVSTIIPDINLIKYTGKYDADKKDEFIDTKVMIKNGEIISGVLDSTTIGKGKSGNIVHTIFNDYNPNQTIEFLTNMQQMSLQYLLKRGITMGFGDIVLKPDVKKKIIEKLKDNDTKTNELIEKVDNGEFIAPLGKSNEEYFEIQMKNELEGIRGDVGKIADKSLSSITNNMKSMVESGSKGSSINVSQITACVGQQDVAARRIDKLFGGRTTPHFQKGDDTPMARGFVYHSYVDGLNPAEFFFHAMAGREGSIDTAIKSVTGDTLIMIMEDNVIKTVNIGDWIDEKLNSTEHEKIDENEQELLELNCNVLIPTVNEKGNVSWELVTAVTRHAPTEYIYKIKTLGGREVIVADSKSLLVWNESKEEFIQMLTPNVKVGDYLPTTMNLPKLYERSEQDITNEINELTIKLNKNTIVVLNPNNLCNVISLYSNLGIYVKIIDHRTLRICNDQHTYNDVVLDKVTYIEKIVTRKTEYTKLYDITVPSTLNFCLANGLHVVDTAESGYISRRIMKLMEDLRVWYDTTVRNGGNQIMQFVYGDDGIDPSCLEKQRFETMKMSDNDLERFYQFSNTELKTILDKKVYVQMNKNELNKKLSEEFMQIVVDRNTLRKMRIDYNIGDTFDSPVNVKRIIINCLSLFNIDNEATIKAESITLSPLIVIDKIKQLCDELPRIYTNVHNVDNDLTERYRYATTMICIMIRSQLASKKVLMEYRFTEEHLDYIINLIRTKFAKAIINPGEMVGAVSAQSMGEPSTQLTLNSIDYEEIIAIRTSKNNMFIGKIGDFIDQKINEADKSKVQLFEKGDQTYVDTKHKDYSILSVDEDGKMHWKKVEAVTKHLPIKDDKIDKLVKVKTRTGRIVTATKGKSFLTNKDGKLVATNGSDLVVGDYLPIMAKMPEPINILYDIGLEDALPKKELIYGSELNKAMKIKEEENAKGNTQWYKENNGKLFTLPFIPSDSAIEAYKSSRKDRENKIEYLEGYIYPRRSIGGFKTLLPEKIQLDELTGFFIGGYLAKGGVHRTQIHISNNDKKFRNKIYEFCNRYHTAIQNDKNNIGWTSTNIYIHSTLLSQVIKIWCGLGSDKKHIPSWAILANDEFIKGLINGYFSGNGTVTKKSVYIMTSSVSEELIDGINILLTRLGIFSKKIIKNNRGSQYYTIAIANGDLKRFTNQIELIVDYKQEIGGHINLPIDKFKCKDCKYNHFQYETTDVFYDEIIEIEEVDATQKYVYDFTVEDTKTFNVFNGLCMMDKTCP